ncbi:DNA-binding MarR family transcriptional regulator [Dongia mobilis]|uniref:DNA-binding MarR family transcriptional regulator n=1 Tax=Dongia mobilis TaxID=578943 RepID=A0A4R6WPU9_9PROT|nr:MarR family transcriptional regulator [Dongia mobilis]TDQ81519.1 DNA-binding MarR family transcriptional regulator [Dongia mobilis]
MTRADNRTANLLGAFALVTMDGIRSELGDLTAIGESDWAALIVLGQSPGITVDRLARIVHLSQPGAVRLVDRLAEEGWVERKLGNDRRARPLQLTAAGERMVRAMLLGRERVLAGALSALDAEERATLSELLDKMLRAAARERDEVSTDSACRLCDERACPQDRCPLTPGCGVVA